MTKTQIKQLIRNTALNKIAKMYHPKYKFPYDNYSELGNQVEQREAYISSIIISMNKEIYALDIKHKKSKE